MRWSSSSEARPESERVFHGSQPFYGNLEPAAVKHALRIVASLLISAVFLVFAARGVVWHDVWSALGSARLVYVLPMVVTSLVSLYFRALRWGVLVRPLTRVSTRTLLAATSMGFAANMLLPLRAGEILRPWVLARKQQLGFAPAMATVAVERLFDMAILIFLFSIATFTLPLPPEWRRYGWFFLVSFFVLLAMLYAFRQYPENVLALLGGLVRPLPTSAGRRIVDVVRRSEEGLTSLGSGAAIGSAVAYSLAVWLSIAMCFGFGLSAFHLSVPWIRGALTTTTFVAIAISIPGGPGFVGMFQVGCVVALGVYDVPASLAFTYSVLTHLVQFASTVAIGLYFFVSEGFHWAEIRGVTQEGSLEAVGEISRRRHAGTPR